MRISWRPATDTTTRSTAARSAVRPLVTRQAHVVSFPAVLRQRDPKFWPFDDVLASAPCFLTTFDPQGSHARLTPASESLSGLRLTMLIFVARRTRVLRPANQVTADTVSFQVRSVEVGPITTFARSSDGDVEVRTSRFVASCAYLG